MSMKKNNIAFIGLGSNLNNPKQQVTTALQHISQTSNIKMLKTSSFYISKPYGYTEQDQFTNAVCKIETTLTCFELLTTLQSIENKQQRIRTIKWGPRTIDLDILAFNQEIIDTPDLKIPHPDFMNREFVLKPWCEIEPKWIMPDGKKLAEIYKLDYSSSKTPP